MEGVIEEAGKVNSALEEHQRRADLQAELAQHNAARAEAEKQAADAARQEAEQQKIIADHTRSQLETLRKKCGK